MLRGLHQNSVESLGRDVPAPACPTKLSEDSSIPSSCSWSQYCALGPVGMLVPQCPCACTPSLLCQMPLGKAAPGLGSRPPSPGLQDLPSPALGKTWPAGRVLAGPVHSILGVRTMQRGWKALWCSSCGARVSLNSRCGFWHQGNVWVHPPGQGSSSTSKDWTWPGVVECYKECKTLPGALWLPLFQAWDQVGQCHQRGWRVAPGTGPWWHYPSLAPAKRRVTAPHVSQELYSCWLPTSVRELYSCWHPFVQGIN